jgi:hypothetical protein
MKQYLLYDIACPRPTKLEFQSIFQLLELHCLYVNKFEDAILIRIIHEASVLKILFRALIHLKCAHFGNCALRPASRRRSQHAAARLLKTKTYEALGGSGDVRDEHSFANRGRRRASVEQQRQQKTFKNLNSLAHIHIPASVRNISGFFVKKPANMHAKKRALL